MTAVAAGRRPGSHARPPAAASQPPPNVPEHDRPALATPSRLRILLVEAFEVPDTPDLSRALAVAVEAADAVLKLAFRDVRDGEPALLIEAERLITGYLAHHFEG